MSGNKGGCQQKIGKSWRLVRLLKVKANEHIAHLNKSKSSQNLTVKIVTEKEKTHVK